LDLYSEIYNSGVTIDKNIFFLLYFSLALINQIFTRESFFLKTSCKIGGFTMETVLRGALEIILETPEEKLKSIFISGLLGDLCSCEADNVNRDEFRQFLGLSSLSSKFKPLLELKGPVTVPAIKERLVIREWFADREQYFSFVESKFKERFFDMKVRPFAETTLLDYRLQKASEYEPIFDKLGYKAVKVPVNYLLALLDQQLDGRKGILAESYSILFPTLDSKGISCFIFIVSYGEGWQIRVVDVSALIEWREGSQVLSNP